MMFDPDRRAEWKVERVSNQLGLTCPYCDQKVLVNRLAWLKGRIPSHYEYPEIFAVLRACVYCTQLARIPRRWLRK